MCEYIIERRGGFAGLPASGKVQADALDAGDRASLDGLLIARRRWQVIEARTATPMSLRARRHPAKRRVRYRRA